MTDISSPQVRRTLGIFFVVFAVLGGALALWTRRQKVEVRAPAAYLVPNGEGTRVVFSLWSGPLNKPRALLPGEKVTVEAGSRVLLLSLDGKVDRYDGPAVIKAPLQPVKEVSALWSPLASLAPLVEAAAASRAPETTLFSPLGATGFTNPLLAWRSRPGVSYDIAVVDPADGDAPPKLLQSVVPPLRVDKLDTLGNRRLRRDRLYSVLLREAGKPETTLTSRILVVPDAVERETWSSPADYTRGAFEGLYAAPKRVGDVYVALKGLPFTWRETELGLRLRLSLALEVGDRVEAGECFRKLGKS